MKKNFNIRTLFIGLLFFGMHAFAQSDYQKATDEWHNKRIQNLKTDNGWLNLAGLFWLQEGKSTFGSSKDNKIVFPEGTIDKKAGFFERNGTTVKITVNNGVVIYLNGKPISEAIIFHPDSTKSFALSHKDLKWNIIQREDKIGIRLRNLKSPLVQNFKGIERFKVDPKWKVEAKLVPNNESSEILISNVLGQTTKEKSSGKLVFKIQDKEYALDVVDETESLFVLFGDATNGDTTYPSGRFLYVDKPDKEGKTTIDFNRAFNPPCAFTPYATCPLPPKQNILLVVIDAGEHTFGQH